MAARSSSTKSGKLCIGFTPDEEVGRGADLFDIAGFGADLAYTIDGGELGELEIWPTPSTAASSASWSTRTSTRLRLA